MTPDRVMKLYMSPSLQDRVYTRLHLFSENKKEVGVSGHGFQALLVWRIFKISSIVREQKARSPSLTTRTQVMHNRLKCPMQWPPATAERISENPRQYQAPPPRADTSPHSAKPNRHTKDRLRASPRPPSHSRPLFTTTPRGQIC